MVVVKVYLYFYCWWVRWELIGIGWGGLGNYWVRMSGWDLVGVGCGGEFGVKVL